MAGEILIPAELLGDCMPDLISQVTDVRGRTNRRQRDCQLRALGVAPVETVGEYRERARGEGLSESEITAWIAAGTAYLADILALDED